MAVGLALWLTSSAVALALTTAPAHDATGRCAARMSASASSAPCRLPRRQLLRTACAAALPAAALPTFAAVAPPALPPLKEELVQILRVREAAGQETRLVTTGKYRELQRLNIKRAAAMMVDNYDLAGRFVRASAAAPRDKANLATSYGNTAVESLIQILEYFQVDLVANDLSPQQQKFVLAALASTTKSIDNFLSLMPPETVAAAKKQIEEENALNLKEFPDGAYLNPTPTVEALGS